MVAEGRRETSAPGALPDFAESSVRPSVRCFLRIVILLYLYWVPTLCHLRVQHPTIRQNYFEQAFHSKIRSVDNKPNVRGRVHHSSLVGGTRMPPFAILAMFHEETDLDGEVPASIFGIFERFFDERLWRT